MKKGLMKSGVVTPGAKGSARLEDMPMPVPDEKEALIRVLEVGIDGTDIEINDGKYGEAPEDEQRLVLGHECLGEIIDAGDSGLRRGELVIPIVRRPDDCPDCIRGQYDMCTKGKYTEHGIKGLHGFMREFFVENLAFLVSVPENIRHIAVLTEPLSVVEKGVTQAISFRNRSAKPIDTALVLGAGPLGLLAIACFRQQNIKTYGLDIVPESSRKAQILKDLGARYINGREVYIEQLPERIGGPDIIFEATGNSSVIFKAMTALGKDGVLCLAGLASGATELPVESGSLLTGLVLENKTIFGSVSSNRSHYERSVQLLTEAEERWPGVMSRIVTGRFGMENFIEALHFTPETIKNVVDIGRRA